MSRRTLKKVVITIDFEEENHGDQRWDSSLPLTNYILHHRNNFYPVNVDSNNCTTVLQHSQGKDEWISELLIYGNSTKRASHQVKILSCAMVRRDDAYTNPFSFFFTSFSFLSLSPPKRANEIVGNDLGLNPEGQIEPAANCAHLNQNSGQTRGPSRTAFSKMVDQAGGPASLQRLHDQRLAQNVSFEKRAAHDGFRWR